MRKTKIDEVSDMSANPYAQGWREWDERYADLVIGKRNWQIAAAGLLLATIHPCRGHGVVVQPQPIRRLRGSSRQARLRVNAS
jgi:type IV secretory pathway TrbF-like protein